MVNILQKIERIKRIPHSRREVAGPFLFWFTVFKTLTVTQPDDFSQFQRQITISANQLSQVAQGGLTCVNVDKSMP